MKALEAEFLLHCGSTLYDLSIGDACIERDGPDYRTPEEFVTWYADKYGLQYEQDWPSYEQGIKRDVLKNLTDVELLMELRSRKHLHKHSCFDLLPLFEAYLVGTEELRHANKIEAEARKGECVY